jgi:hypothetical protein
MHLETPQREVFPGNWDGENPLGEDPFVFQFEEIQFFFLKLN